MGGLEEGKKKWNQVLQYRLFYQLYSIKKRHFFSSFTPPPSPFFFFLLVFLSFLFYIYFLFSFFECGWSPECCSQIKELVVAHRDPGSKYSRELECLSLSLLAHPLKLAVLRTRKQFNLFTTVWKREKKEWMYETEGEEGVVDITTPPHSSSSPHFSLSPSPHFSLTYLLFLHILSPTSPFKQETWRKRL